MSELGQVQGELVSLGQAAEVISQGLTLEAASAIKENLASLKSRADAVSTSLRQKADIISEAIVGRKELEGEVKVISEWMLDTERRLAGCERVAPNEVTNKLEALHILLQDHTEQTPKFEQITRAMSRANVISGPDDTLALHFKSLLNNYKVVLYLKITVLIIV